MKTCCVRETHIKPFSSLTTEDKISVASDKNRAVCARLKTTENSYEGLVKIFLKFFYLAQHL